MKIYIEAIEDIEENPDFIQEEITDTEQIAKDKCKLKEKVDKTYKYRKHYCNHYENKPCTVEDII